MVYSNYIRHISCITVCIMFISCLFPFVPWISENSYASGKKAKIKISELYVDDTVSQKGLSKKEKKKGYRIVKVRWKKTGKHIAKKYVVFVRRGNGKTQKFTATKKRSKTLKLKKGKVYYISVKGYSKKAPGKKSATITYKPGSNNAKSVDFVVAHSQMVEGDKVQFSAVANGGLTDSIKWKSSNKNVLRVNSLGFVTTYGPGNATITATAHNGVKGTIRVNVLRNYPSVVTISNGSKASILNNKTLALLATTDEAWDKSIKWKSSDKTVATVDSNGIVTAKTSGTVKITAQANSFLGQKAAKDTIRITVIGTMEGMVIWAKNAAKNNKIGYSMGTSRYKGSRNRYCHLCVTNGSKDYDCASFVAAALVHGYGGREVRGLCNNVGGCRSLYNYLLSNGWENMGKLSFDKLKRGDILINPGAHVEIFLGEKDKSKNWLNVAAHDDRDGKTGDRSGTEVSIAPSRYFSYYTAVLRKD